MTRLQLHPDSPWLLALLAAMVALGPLSVDMYLPAMPRMMTALNTDIWHMHLTLSTYLTGFAIFHLACGPLADRFGRKPILIGGTVLFVAASIGCSLSTTVDELLVYRFIQGIGACVGPTLARAVARDIFGPTRAARALSLIAMLMALAPAVAPTMGSILLLWLPWPIVFIFLAIYGATMIVLIQIFLVYYALPAIDFLPGPGELRIDMGPVTAGIVAITLNSVAFVTEILRGGLAAIHKGQYEAASALGLRNYPLWRKVILPQLFMKTIPPLVSEFTQVLKATPLLAMITVVEMMRVSQQIFSANYHPVEVLSGAFVLYFLICFVVSRSSILLERRFAVRSF